MISTITTWFFAYYALLDTSNIQDDHRILIILCSGLVVGCISVCLTWTFLYFLTFIVTSITFNVINLIMSKYIFNMNEDNAFVLLVFAIIFSYILLQRYRNDIEIYLTSIFGAYYFISSLDFYGYHYQLWHHLSLALDVDEPSFFTNPIMNEKFYIFVLIWALLVMCGIRFQYKDKSRYNPSAYHEIVQNHHHHTVLVTPPFAPVTYVAPQKYLLKFIYIYKNFVLFYILLHLLTYQLMQNKKFFFYNPPKDLLKRYFFEAQFGYVL